jgi:hypothetical protein
MAATGTSDPTKGVNVTYNEDSLGEADELELIDEAGSVEVERIGNHRVRIKFKASGGGLPVSNVDFGDDTTTAQEEWERAGSRSIDMSQFPATLGAKARSVLFKVVLENSHDTNDFYVEARLWDVTHDVLVAGTTLSNEGEADRNVAVEFTSGELTVGNAAGNIRSDEVTIYRVEFRIVEDAGVVQDSYRAILGNARVQFYYTE